ncbi:MAG TPA: bacillithiol biosynthesis deacetylase BshB1 [Flavobacteriales bacterium]|nr:bacillithiol biosynthesis deacetylase BshB1 [Flavobacteriales bacterium]
MKLDILAFGAHPDDIEISAGGLIISEVLQGKKVGLIDLTRGEMGTRGTPEIRDEESRVAAEIMGVSVRENLGLADGLFEINHENTFKVIDAIRRYQPDIVITNAPHDRHPDHGRAATLVAEACFLAGLFKMQKEGVETQAWRPRAIFQYIQFLHHTPHFIYDISEVLETKIAAIKAHKSQFWNPESTEPQTLIASEHFFQNLTSRASEYGIQSGFKFGEPFLTVRFPGVQSLEVLR